MNDDVKRLRHEQWQESQSTEESAQSTAREFNSTDELLRHDAAQNPPPDRIVERLNESLAKEPAPPTPPWWKRLFSN